MTQTQQQIEHLRTLQESFDELADHIENLANTAKSKAYYDNTTGNLTLENIELTIE